MTEHEHPIEPVSYPDVNTHESIFEDPVPIPPHRSPLGRLFVFLFRLGHRIMIPSTSFWILFLLIVAAASALRTYRLDLPPIDYPADRQHTNATTIDSLRHGASLLSMTGAWMELRLLPWITARTAALCATFHCEIWTLARFWSAFFGVLTVMMAACAGYWAAAVPGSSRPQRRRIALFWMAALAFNPYHWQISRLIMTESITLAMQMSAVAFFWIAYRHPRNFTYFAVFIVFFILSGWAKIPSLIWLPGFFLYFVMNPATRGRTGRTAMFGGAAFLLGLIAIFWIYKVNPFRIVKEYEKSYPYLGQQMRAWMGTPLWIKTYLSRIALMLTLPGVVLALIGFLTAPWLFRITTLTFMAGFYMLVNLNTYNFCHIIIPGTALAAWGANSLIEASSGETAASILRGWSERSERLQRRLNQVLGLALGVLLVWWLFPLGPDGRPTAQPRGEILQAVKVIKQFVPKGRPVFHDDGERSLSYMSGQSDDTYSGDKFDLRTGYYYLLERFSDRPLQYASAGWVKWASLPGESNGILFTRPPGEPAAAEKAKFQVIPGPGAPPPGQTSQTQPAGGTLTATSYSLPLGPYDAARQVLFIHPEKSVTIGITWKNPRNYPLAGILWRSERWERPIAVPVREGGFAIAKGGVLCVPDGNPVTAYYTFEIPRGFPAGTYSIQTYPLSPGPWHEPEGAVETLPFKVVCDSDVVPEAVIDRSFRALYPGQYTTPPFLWANKWFFRDMGGMPEGYSFGGTIDTYFLTCPMRQEGVYELTIRGEALPLYGNADPENVWPVVEAYLPSDLKTPVARVVLNSRKTSEFKVSFTAMQPFDGLMLKAIGDFGPDVPVWTNDFIPSKCGRQTLNLRGFRLAPQRQILPGLIDTLNAPPSPKKANAAQATPL